MAEYAKDDESPTPKAVPEADEAILQELRDRYDYASTEWAPIIAQGDIDVRYSAGDVWNQEDRDARAGRPVETYDQLSQYTNQLVNSFRQNPRGAKVSPAGGGATDQTAELRANRIRQIEYDSHAQEVYTVAGENMVTRGYGFARLLAEYENSQGDEQALRLKAIPNPNQVLPDPDAESTSGADWQYLFFVHTLTRREFRRDYPDAQIKDFEPNTIALAPKWFGKDGRIQIAEYWYVTETAPVGGKGRPQRTVCMYLTNGVELLQKPGYPKKTEWRGSTIPFAMAAGQIVYTTDGTGDSQKMFQSYIRKARSAAKSYSWTKSTELEALAQPVKAALFAYEGQLDQKQIDQVELSTQKPVALILAKATFDGLPQGTVLPLPQYGKRSPDIQGYEIAAESFRRDVQNALGRYSAQDHRMGSTKVTSGVALRELDKSGDLGSYHFVAHYDDMIRELAVKLDELLPFYDGGQKEITTRLPDGSTKRVKVNSMTGRAPSGDPMYGPEDNPISAEHRHAITISTGPSSDSQRAEGKEAALALLANPAAFPVIAADSVRLMDLGPIGDQMAEDLEYIQPPAMQEARKQKDNGGAPDPRQMMQQIGQMKQQLQHAEAVMQQQHGELEGKQAEIASKEKIAQMEIDSKERIAAADRAYDRETKLAVAYELAKTKDKQFFFEERARIGAHLQDAAAQASDQLHEHVQGDLTRQHAVGMAAAGASASADEAQAQRDHAAEMGSQGHEQALEQQQQAADLAPERTAGA